MNGDVVAADMLLSNIRSVVGTLENNTVWSKGHLLLERNLALAEASEYENMKLLLSENLKYFDSGEMQGVTLKEHLGNDFAPVKTCQDVVVGNGKVDVPCATVPEFDVRRRCNIPIFRLPNTCKSINQSDANLVPEISFEKLKSLLASKLQPIIIRGLLCFDERKFLFSDVLLMYEYRYCSIAMDNR